MIAEAVGQLLITGVPLAMVMVKLLVVEPKPFEAITLRDRVTALRKFRSITQLFKTHDEFRFYVLLAQDQVDAIVKSGGADEDYVLYLNKRLKEADSLFKQGKQTEAEEIWTSIRTLYKENEEVRAHVSFATKRLNRDEVGTPPWVDAEPAP